MDNDPTLVSGRGYGIDNWKNIFLDRQMLALTVFTDEIKKTHYHNTYASILALADELGSKIINVADYDKNNINIYNETHYLSGRASCN